MRDHFFVALCKRANEQSIFRSYKKCKRAKNNQKISSFPYRSFFAQKKSNRSLSIWNKCWAITHLLHCSSPIFKRAIVWLLIRSLKRSKWVIALFVALCKRAIEQLITHLLFKKEQLSDWLLICSPQKSNEKSNLTFALSKRAKMSDRSFSNWANAPPWFFL